MDITTFRKDSQSRIYDDKSFENIYKRGRHCRLHYDACTHIIRVTLLFGATVTGSDTNRRNLPY